MNQKIHMVDLHGQYEARKSEFDSAIHSVISRSAFINGPEVELFQKELETYLDVNNAITCANGTDALTIALWALDLEPGSEVITADFTFIATAEAIARVGLVPILVDVTPNTFTIDVTKIEQAITPKTKVIMPVHLFGQAADMNAIMNIAKKHNLYVIEDCAQCFGADYAIHGQNKKLGTIGDIGCTSFFPSKNLGCFGDGGAMFSNNEALAEKMRMIANHGSLKKYYHPIIGVNSRLDGIQAAILRVKLRYIDMYNAARKQAAQWYNQKLSTISWIEIPQLQPQSTHVFHQYTIKLKGVRNTVLQTYLQENGIPSMIYYPVAMHKQEALASFSPAPCPTSDSLTHEVLSLPMHTELSQAQIDYICNTIANYTI
jgi:UDP-2-acetamido-2-deoxy-ribo-hexuluronate aminotransferase